jgi:hypothetical protein
MNWIMYSGSRDYVILEEGVVVEVDLDQQPETYTIIAVDVNVQEYIDSYGSDFTWYPCDSAYVEYIKDKIT